MVIGAFLAERREEVWFWGQLPAADILPILERTVDVSYVSLWAL